MLCYASGFFLSFSFSLSPFYFLSIERASFHKTFLCIKSKGNLLKATRTLEVEATAIAIAD